MTVEPIMTTPNPDRLWTMKDVAQYLGIPVKTLYNWRTEGQGPKGVRIGKHIRFDPQDVVAWFESQKTAA